ncbi:MAG: chromate transporter [Anaeroplasma bactoclasticum]|nr:chromate transporter [Anaeroplasma bactoclasticum]
MKKIKSLWQIFIAMFKMGLFTFGGGYAMIGLLENEFINHKKWINGEEFMDLVTIAESTPGPIAINCATYIGYKKEKIIGAIIATLGMCLPSFTIIYLISLFFNQFLAISWVNSAFKGIKMCVIFLILSAGYKMLKKIEKNRWNILIVSMTFLCMLIFSLLSIRFSSIFYILMSGSIGLFIYIIRYIKAKKDISNDEVRNDLS